MLNTDRNAMKESGSEEGPAPDSLSVIVPVTERHDPLGPLVADYLALLRALDRPFELICVVDGAYAATMTELESIKAANSELTLIRLPRSYGDATAITVGFEASHGEWILLLPPYRHFVVEDIRELLHATGHADVIVGRREQRADGWVNRVQSKIFSGIVSRISGLKLSDAGCPARLLRREVLEEVQLYGDYHRFLPIMADRQGFTVQEVGLRQAAEDSHTRIYAPGVYLRRFLDLLSIYFILKFTKKPFRFFGLIGSSVFAIGTIVAAWVVVERLAYGMALADRPALLLGSMLMVFGLQILSVGLIGEIIIFSHARETKEFNVRRIIG